ncbi:solute carrier family 22 member 3-like [Danaus plexippus]|uniref:solute carrier family 22 member 3-like n=1 Tax=Danaus plexippus TaxID=13037 RepID=UPI002AAF42BF|nr:solute carrier family 22 member 3-like [Danaus plexippus]
MKDNTEVTNVADILEKFGKYQMLQYFYASLPALVVAMINVNYIFVAGEVNYRCRVPECDSLNSTYNVTWWPASVDECSKPVLNQTLDDVLCTNDSFAGSREKCTDWIYENHDTIISEYDLACQPWKRTMVGTIHNIGMALAEMAAGWLADIYGRKFTTVICAIGCIIGNFKTLAPNYNTYVSIEFIEALICGGVYTSGGVLMLEIAGSDQRLLAGVVFAYAVYMGEAIFALIGMAVPYWKSLIQIICTPSLLFFFYFISIHESPRWLIIKDRIDEAREILKNMVRMNKLNVDEDELNNIDNEKLKALYSYGDSTKKQGLKQIYQCKKLLLWVLVSSFCRFTVSFVYYGLLINSVVLPGDKYTNFLLAAVMSFPGELISLFLMNKIGRKLPLMVGFLLCGISCVASGYVSNEHAWLKICLFLVGKLVTAACYTGTLTYSMELFPTSVRGSLIGLCTLAACLGNMLAPLTPLLTPLLSSILFASSAVISSVLLIFTPETKGAPLIDTIEQIYDKSLSERKKQNENSKENSESMNTRF